ncbi:NAD(P)-dependent glycerol-3-phosphate dehydrogenase [bacterium]|nr:NAD(P)-dependent glycerol-3-phosphate dehydrogenase [bacterium]
MQNNGKKLTVLGPGCWGLTLAWLLSDNFENVCVWGRESDLNDELINNKHCSKPLEVQLQDKVQITSDMPSAIKDADIILLVVATAGIRSVCENLKKSGLKSDQILLNASKGIELNTLMRMSEVIKDVLPEQKIAILSGPTLAKEVLMGKPTAASVASEDLEVAEYVQNLCSVPNRFRLYTNNDVIGVELGGSLKNVIAIASGFAHEMGLGDNCAGSLLTRGMAEIVRVSVRLGANPSTLYGLSGMGDLIATCSSPMSRNFTVGSMIARGKKIDDILAELGSVAEGVQTSKAICDLAEKLDIEVPLSNAIYKAVYTDITPEEILAGLMNRKLKKEESYV